jgi:UPF0755 protein
MIKKLLISITILLLITVGALGTYVTSYLNKTYDGADANFVVENGDTFGKINQRLFNQGLISNTRFFHYMAKYKKVMTKFRAGSYTIVKGSNMSDVLNTLVYGQANLTSITIPEGKNMYEVAKLLEAAGVTKEKDFLDIIRDQEFISQFNISADSLEGYLYPETYRFVPNSPAKVVAKTMLDLFRKKTEHINFTHPFFG